MLTERARVRKRAERLQIGSKRWAKWSNLRAEDERQECRPRRSSSATRFPKIDR